MVFQRMMSLLTITFVIVLLFDGIRAAPSANHDDDPGEGGGEGPSEVRRALDHSSSTDRPRINPIDDNRSEALELEQLSTRSVRVALRGAKSLVRNECENDPQCGTRYICCLKKWCDLTVECGSAKFCLPNCAATKTTYLYKTSQGGQPLIDVVYD